MTLTVHSAANPQAIEIAGARFSEHHGTVADVSRTVRNAEKRDRIVVAAMAANRNSSSRRGARQVVLIIAVAVAAAMLVWLAVTLKTETNCVTQSPGSVEHWLAGCRVKP